MRIALMTNNYKPMLGGVPISIERLARGLEAQGHQVTIFAPTYKRKNGVPMQDEPNVVRYAVCMNHFIGGIVLPNPFDPRIEEEFKKNTYDIIHVHHPMLIGRTAVYLSRKYNIPLTFTYHTRYEQYLKYYTGKICSFDHFMAAYLHTFLKHCDFVFAPTLGIQQYLVERCRMAPERTGILPTGIEKENFEVGRAQSDEIRRKYGAEKMPMLLTVSRMAHEKNVGFLLESLARVKELYGRPFRVVMAGGGPDRKALQERSVRLGLEDIVVFTGEIPNEQTAPYFKAADGFIFASKTETQGIVVLEAFAGAAPVIAVRASGVEDLVEDGVNGILAEENVEEYAKKLTEFLEGVPVQGEEAAWKSGNLPCPETADEMRPCPEAADEMRQSQETADGRRQNPKRESAESRCRELEEAFQRSRGRECRFIQMSENAYSTGLRYREETVALKAARYYNDIIAEHEAKKKSTLRLLLESVK